MLSARLTPHDARSIPTFHPAHRRTMPEIRHA